MMLRMQIAKLNAKKNGRFPNKCPQPKWSHGHARKTATQVSEEFSRGRIPLTNITKTHYYFFFFFFFFFDVLAASCPGVAYATDDTSTKMNIIRQGTPANRTQNNNFFTPTKQSLNSLLHKILTSDSGSISRNPSNRKQKIEKNSVCCSYLQQTPTYK